jgi:hypothetical protein
MFLLAGVVGDVERRSFVQQAAFFYSDLFHRPTQMVGQLLFDDVYEFLTVRHDAEHNVFTVQARRGSGRDEKLTAVRVWACERKLKAFI